MKVIVGCFLIKFAYMRKVIIFVALIAYIVIPIEIINAGEFKVTSLPLQCKLSTLNETGFIYNSVQLSLFKKIKTCKRGNISVRDKRGRCLCVDCKKYDYERRELQRKVSGYYKKWRQANPEKVKAITKKWNDAHKKQRRAIEKSW